MKIWDQIATPRIVEKTMRRKDWSKFTWYQVLFWVSYTAFDKVLSTKEEAKEWIRQVEATIPSVNVLHRSIF